MPAGAEVESLLEEGRLKAVVTSTSLELGVDIGTADLSVLIGTREEWRGACSGWGDRATAWGRPRGA